MSYFEITKSATINMDEARSEEEAHLYRGR